VQMGIMSPLSTQVQLLYLGVIWYSAALSRGDTHYVQIKRVDVLTPELFNILQCHTQPLKNSPKKNCIFSPTPKFYTLPPIHFQKIILHTVTIVQHKLFCKNITLALSIFPMCVINYISVYELNHLHTLFLDSIFSFRS
jgi:hypothetical protein